MRGEDEASAAWHPVVLHTHTTKHITKHILVWGTMCLVTQSDSLPVLTWWYGMVYTGMVQKKCVIRNVVLY